MSERPLAPVHVNLQQALVLSKACQAMNKVEALESQGKHCPAGIFAGAEEEAAKLRKEYHELTGIVLAWRGRP